MLSFPILDCRRRLHRHWSIPMRAEAHDPCDTRQLLLLVTTIELAYCYRGLSSIRRWKIDHRSAGSIDEAEADERQDTTGSGGGIRYEREVGADLEEWRVAQSTKERLLAMEMELDLASRMQKSILPTAFPESRDYQNHARMEPAREVGGDFYDLIRLEDEKVGIVMADVSEKGVPAVQPTVSIRTMLKGAAISYENPCDVLTEVNSLICKENDGEKYVTVLYAVYNPSYSSLTYAYGGHESPLLIHRDGVLERFPTTKRMALGATLSESFEENTILLAPGDTVICYTDGATDAEDTAGEQFGQDRLARLFEEETSYGAGESVDMVSSGIDDFVRGATQADDITCLALYRT